MLSILAALAVPAYKDYVARAQVYEGITLLQGLRTQVMTHYDVQGSLPSSSDIPTVSNPTDLIEQLAVDNNGGNNGINVIKINVRFSSNADAELSGKSIFMEGKVENGAWEWLCRHSVGILVIDNKYLPQECQFSGSCNDVFCLDDP